MLCLLRRRLVVVVVVFTCVSFNEPFQVCQAQEARENTHPRTRLRYIPPGFNVAAHDPYYAQAAASAGASVTPMGDVMKVEQPPSDQATLIFFGSLDRWSHRSVGSIPVCLYSHISRPKFFAVCAVNFSCLPPALPPRLYIRFARIVGSFCRIRRSWRGPRAKERQLGPSQTTGAGATTL